jgi:hypothetical protein
MDKFKKVFEADLQNSIDNFGKEEKIEETILGTAAQLLTKFKGLKPVKQAGNVAKSLKGSATSFGPGYKNLTSGGMDKFAAAKKSFVDVSKSAGESIKNNPYGAGALGGGGALAAWGLKPKKKQVAEAAGFDFAKKKEEGKGKGEEALTKAKEKAKGKDKRVKYFKDEKADKVARFGGPMIGKERKEKGKEFVEELKKKGAKEIDKKEFKRSGRPPGRFTKRRDLGGFGKGPREIDVNMFKKSE